MTTWQDLILGNNQEGGVVKKYRKRRTSGKRRTLGKRRSAGKGKTACKRKVNMKKTRVKKRKSSRKTYKNTRQHGYRFSQSNNINTFKNNIFY